MDQLIKVKGLKGKQNKKKWAKNIDVSGLLQAQVRKDDEEIRQKYQTNIQVVDDMNTTRAPLDPNRFKNQSVVPPKKKYNNQIKRQLDLSNTNDPWITQDNSKHRYKPTQVPAVVIPESGHSYRPRQQDKNALIDRIIDYEMSIPNPRKIKSIAQPPQVQVRHRNKKKRAAQLQARARTEDKQFRQQVHNVKKIKKEIEQKQEEIAVKIKTKQIKKERQNQQTLAGRVRKGPKLGKKSYRFKQMLPEKEVDKVSKVELSDDLIKQRFDSIYRRGVFEARNIKVHANRRKHIKVKEREFI